MFLLSSLCNKHVAMNRSFRVSLLYLLLLIPQHGNSPLPVMESWLQKDQDDGFVQRDMTSSLTGGDESFGSAHQTYQNSLIRKKKSEGLGDDIIGQGFRKFSSKYDQNHNELFPQSNVIFDDRYVNQEYGAPAAENPKSDGIFDQFSSDSGIPLNKLRTRISSVRNQNRELPVSSFKDSYGEKTPLRGSLLSLRKNKAQNFEGLDSNSDWGMCKEVEGSYSPNSLLSLPSPVDDGLNFGENLPVENAYVSLEDDRTSRQLANQEYADVSESDAKHLQLRNGNEYYETGENTMAVDENNAPDYNQMLNDHVYKRKRKEIQPAKPNSSPLETRLTKELSDPQAAEIKTREVDGSPESEVLWNMGPEVQTQALNNVVKNSQRVLQEVKQLQQKVSYTQGEGEGRAVKREGRDPPVRKSSLTLDEKRLKREDEDEQKNMKTGTDEGGGGEYEDEEGKGHKDEEEYYEDADLSDDESETQIRTTNELNQKYVKREVVQDPSNKNSKAMQTENNSEDYELNLENAPIENLEKSRKSYREGEKTKKNSVRKGVKIWDQWGKWSPCSVTCGVGRCTRWRHCIGGGCAQGEKEAQIKRCTNPACR